MRTVLIARLVLACLVLTGCASGPAEDNFRQVMGRQVGKRVDDPDFYPQLYRLKQVESTRLPNGNREEQYLAGPKGRCHVFFEVDPSERVVAWRAEGESDCVIVPTGTR